MQIWVFENKPILLQVQRERIAESIDANYDILIMRILETGVEQTIQTRFYSLLIALYKASFPLSLVYVADFFRILFWNRMRETLQG